MRKREGGRDKGVCVCGGRGGGGVGWGREKDRGGETLNQTKILCEKLNGHSEKHVRGQPINRHLLKRANQLQEVKVNEG